MTGGAATSIVGGGGVCHDFKALGTCMFFHASCAPAKGEGEGSLEDELEDELVANGSERAFEGIPALRRAILVVSFVNIADILPAFLFPFLTSTL